MELIEAIKMKNAFVSLFNIYAHELSKYNPWIGTQIDGNGNYLSEHVTQFLNDKSNESFCITEEKKPIGFVVFSYSDNPDENICYIAEIFVIETSRKKGIAEKICKSYWSNNSGTCRLDVLKSNFYGVAYWEKLIQKCGYAYKKHDHDEQMWVYEFKLGLQA